jgi:hypothetical protein
MARKDITACVSSENKFTRKIPITKIVILHYNNKVWKKNLQFVYFPNSIALVLIQLNV